MTEATSSPLHAAHRDAGGRFIVFAGWRLPVHYGSILREGRAVRSGCGIFDVSHMGRLRVRGPDALGVLQRLGTNDLTKIRPGKAQYTVWCQPDGGAVDDLIVSWLDHEEFLVVVNASRRDDDLTHLEAEAQGRDVTVIDETLVTAMIAVQGPQALGMVESLGLAGARELPRFGVARATFEGVGVVVSRTGYTGEDGVEIIAEAGAGPRIWEALRAAGAVPCGLGARDALRLEVGYPLYGHELDAGVSPFEAGVGFAVALDKDDFIGRKALTAAAESGLSRRLLGFVCDRPCVPAPGDAVTGDGLDGTVTSGGTSVVRDAPIGLAFVSTEAGRAPERLRAPVAGTLRNRGKSIDIQIQEVPLIERKRPKP